MFAHYVIIAIQATGSNTVIGSSAPVDDVEWPRVFFGGGSLINLATGRIKIRGGATVTVLSPEHSAYIDPVTLGTNPPRGAQVTLVSRLRDGTTVTKRPGDGTNTTVTSPGGKFNVRLDGSSGVQIGSGNVQHGGGTQIGSGNTQVNRF